MPRLGPGERSKIGGTLIAAASMLDTDSIAVWLSAFTETHNRYLNAQQEVVARDKRVVQAKGDLDGRNGDLDKGLIRLELALVLSGQPRANPFRGYKVPTPAVLQRRARGSKAVIAQRLAASVSQRVNASADMRSAAAATDAAAIAVLRAIDVVNRALGEVATARRARDAIGRQWDTDLSALRHAAAASPERHLAKHLFSGIRHRKKKSPRKEALPGVEGKSR